MCSMQALARVEHWVWLLLHLRQHPKTPLLYEAVSTGALNGRRKRDALSMPRAIFFLRTTPDSATHQHSRRLRT